MRETTIRVPIDLVDIIDNITSRLYLLENPTHYVKDDSWSDNGRVYFSIVGDVTNDENWKFVRFNDHPTVYILEEVNYVSMDGITRFKLASEHTDLSPIINSATVFSLL